MTDKIKSMKSQNATVLLLGLFILPGCNQVGNLDLAPTGSLFNSSNVPAYQHTISESVSTSDAFVQLPADAGQILGVSQTRYGNGVEQLVVYQGDAATRGENTAQIKMALHVEGKKQTESLKVGSTSIGRISNELRTVLPNVAMQVSNEIHTNAYGPFGYALGRAPDGVRCIYGWQRMKGSKKDRWAVFKRFSQKPLLSIRLRVCRSNVTNSQLVGLMQNLRVTADPAAVLRPTAVSWDAGPGVRTTGVLPRYKRSGFASEQREIYEEPVRETRVKRVRPRRVKTTPRIVHVQPQAAPVVQVNTMENKFQAPAYRPPLPGNHTPSGSRAVGKTLVPVPPGSATVRPIIKPAVVAAPLVTARTYQPETPIVTPVRNVSTTPVTVSGSHSAVPLPN